MLFLARHASEDASGAAGGCSQSVESAVMRAFENAFNVAGAVPRAFENASRAPGALFCHRMSQKTLRVPQEAVLRTEYLFCTGKACFWYGALPKNASHLVVRSTEKRVAVASERPVHPRTGQGEWSARDKFRVSGTKEMVEGVGANKVSGVLSEASCCRCGAWRTKKEADSKVDLFL